MIKEIYFAIVSIAIIGWLIWGVVVLGEFIGENTIPVIGYVVIVVGILSVIITLAHFEKKGKEN